MKKKHPIIKFALCLGIAMAFVAMVTFILISNLPPVLQNRADMWGIFITGYAFIALIIGSAMWAFDRWHGRQMADSRWYFQRQYLEDNAQKD